jgi:hypothetical protein
VDINDLDEQAIAALEEPQEEAEIIEEVIPETSEPSEAPEETPRKFLLRGKEYTEEELMESINSGLRQADYTRKTQEIAEKERQFEANKAAFIAEYAPRIQTVHDLDRWLAENQEEAKIIYTKLAEKVQKLESTGTTPSQIMNDPVVRQLNAKLDQATKQIETISKRQEEEDKKILESQLVAALTDLRERKSAECKDHGIAMPEYSDAELCRWCAENQTPNLEAGFQYLFGKTLLDSALQAGESKALGKYKGKSGVRVEGSRSISSSPRTTQTDAPVHAKDYNEAGELARAELDSLSS